MRKRALAIFLSLVLSLSAAAPAFAAEGAPSWAAEAYQTLERRSVLPNLPVSGTITRGDFVRLLVGVLDSAIPQSELSAYPAKDAGYFHDDYYDPALLRAAAYGILEGSISDGLRYAYAYDPLTREQAAAMVCSLLDLYTKRLGHTAVPTDSPAVYSDTASISPWALPYTATISSYRLMVGDEQRRFDPQSKLEWPQAVVLARSILDLLDAGMGEVAVLPLKSQVNWFGAAQFGASDNAVAKPKTGYAMGYYTISNGDGTVSGLVVGTDHLTVERFDAGGGLVSSKVIAKELPIFGAFFDSGTHFYLAFGQLNDDKRDSQEVFRVVQYDRAWNRLGAVSVNGKDSYATEPFRATVSRMAVSGDGSTVTLYASRTRYDGHQSNITILMNTAPFSIQKVMGEEFPSNHVSHSFGQFIQYDGSKMVTVDHGDAYPRSFVLLNGDRTVELLKLAGKTGDNVTNAIGSGFEVSADGYLFLGCSDPQDGGMGAPWNVFLVYAEREAPLPTPPWPEGSTNTSLTFPSPGYCQAVWTYGGVTYRRSYPVEMDSSSAHLTWLTRSQTTINCARLVKLDEATFVAMWQVGRDIHYQVLGSKGQTVGQEQIVSGTTMPPTQPVVIGRDICWIQVSAQGTPKLYRISF